MHRPYTNGCGATTAISSASVRAGSASTWLRCVLELWRNLSSTCPRSIPLTRATVLLMQVAAPVERTAVRPHSPHSCDPFIPTAWRSHLSSTRRASFLGAGVRGVRGVPLSMSSTSTAGSSSSFASSLVSSSAFVCARRWASAGRRPTYQEIAEALDTLKVNIDDDASTIKKRYRELVKAHHPDAGGEEKTMAKITVAYERLESLSKREREEFALQRKMFGGAGGAGNPYQARAAYTGRRGNTSPFGYAYGNTGGSADNDPFRGAAGASGHYYQGADPFANARAQQQSYWNFYNRQRGAEGTSFSQNPFSGSNPFSMHNQMRRARFMPSGTLFVQGFVLYLFVTFMLLFAYRTYRDYRHEDGWRMSESLARHEQLQELHRLRQEMNERARQMQQGEDPQGFNRPLRANETAESRALEYARQRRIKAIQEQRQQQQVQGGDLPELRGWPKIVEEQGRIIKRAQDPPGVVFFEPTREDARARQIRNQRRTESSVSSWKAKSDSAVEAERAAKAASGADGRSAVPPGVLGAHGTDPSQPLPPEANVGAVFASQVTNTAETREALNKILGMVRKVSQEHEAAGK